MESNAHRVILHISHDGPDQEAPEDVGVLTLTTNSHEGRDLLTQAILSDLMGAAQNVLISDEEGRVYYAADEDAPRPHTHFPFDAEVIQ